MVPGPCTLSESASSKVHISEKFRLALGQTATAQSLLSVSRGVTILEILDRICYLIPQAEWMVLLIAVLFIEMCSMIGMLTRQW